MKHASEAMKKGLFLPNDFLCNIMHGFIMPTVTNNQYSDQSDIKLTFLFSVHIFIQLTQLSTIKIVLHFFFVILTYTL